MQVIDLSGTPGEIGRAHGRLLAEPIRAHLAAWKAALAGQVGDVAEWIDRLVEGTGFVASARSHVPALVEEVEALAAGAAIDLVDAWLLQLIDESWALLEGRLDGLGCTSFGVVHGSRSFTGQTMDLEPFRRGFDVALRIHPVDGPEQLVVTVAGCIGLLGLTRAGYAVLVNALAQVPAVATGLPVAAVMRQVLAQRDLDAAIEWLRRCPHATGQHYLLASARQVTSLECSPAGIAQVMPGASRVWHTNHPLVGYLLEPDDAESELRWEAVRPTIGLPGWGRPRSRQILENPPVCRSSDDGRGALTVAAAMIEQASWPAELWVTSGPPDTAEWVHVAW